MDKISTQEFPSKESIITKALRSEKMPKPAETSLAFIRNFAHNFRVQRCANGTLQEFVLN